MSKLKVITKWKEIENHPMYEVSILGEIRSWKKGKYGKADKPKILKMFDNGVGYSCVRIDNKTYRVNILVLNTFKGLKPNSKAICRHIDSDKKNNYLTNLEWSSYEQNYQDRKKLGLGNEGSKHGMYKHGKYSQIFKDYQIHDMPKILSPFKRRIDKNKRYTLYNEITKGMDWVFDATDVIATEKLDGINVSIVIEDGKITRIFNRTSEIPFFNKGKKFITEAILNSFERGYCNFTDGQYFGECIGPKVNGNPYKLKEHLWIPFSSYVKTKLAYKSWGKYPKDFKTISNWFKDDIFSLFERRRDIVIMKPEGIVFVQLSTGKMAKLRVDMFDWFGGKAHKWSESKREGDLKDVK